MGLHQELEIVKKNILMKSIHTCKSRIQDPTRKTNTTTNHPKTQMGIQFFDENKVGLHQELEIVKKKKIDEIDSYLQIKKSRSHKKH